MFTRFSGPARHAVVRAGCLALEAGRPTLGPDLMLLALAELRPFAGPLPAFTATPDAVRDRVDTGRSRALLATLGIDLEEVRRRTGPDDPHLWRLSRSRINPLRVTLAGPRGLLVLEPHLRKVVEVAHWVAQRRRPGPVTGEGLLWGLFADGSNGAARLLAEAGVDLRPLVTELGMDVHRRTA